MPGTIEFTVPPVARRPTGPPETPMRRVVASLSLICLVAIALPPTARSLAEGDWVVADPDANAVYQIAERPADLQPNAQTH